ncbi:LysM peptidoglycan-binding domain-containing protein [bacterium]|nr:LysM peptidoglycan-binding domain-containing protein [bacterium]
MNRLGKSMSSLVIAGVSILLVGGALITTLAQSGFSPTPYIAPTNTAIQINTQPPQEVSTSTPEENAEDTPDATLPPTQTSSAVLPSSTPTTVQTSENAPSATAQPACTTPSTWIKYTVQSGDTLYSIAILFQTTYLTLQTGNCMSGSSIYTGDILYVPDNATITPTTKPTKAPTKTTAPTNTATNTATAVPSNTPVPTATFTDTPIPTSTDTPTPTPTPTETLTDTPTG